MAAVATKTAIQNSSPPCKGIPHISRVSQIGPFKGRLSHHLRFLGRQAAVDWRKL